MNLTFYTFQKKNNSTARPTGGTSVGNVLIKDACSRFNPIFKLTNYNYEFNYCYWPEMDAYYFIDDVVFMNNNYYELHCIEDVLATWRGTIGDMSPYVYRCSATYDGRVVDSLYATRSDIEYKTMKWPNSGRYPAYLLRTTTQKGYYTYLINEATYKDLLDRISSSLFGENIIESLGTAFNNLLSNPGSNIITCYWIPDIGFNMGIASEGVGTPTTEISIGDKVEGSVMAEAYHFYDSKFQIRKLAESDLPFKVTYTLPLGTLQHPQASSRGIYLNGSPYRTFTVDLGFTGTVKLGGEKLLTADRLILDIWQDGMGPRAKYIISAQTGSTTSTKVPIYVNIGPYGNVAPLQSTDGLENFLTSVGGMETNLATGNWAGLANSAVTSGQAMQSVPNQFMSASGVKLPLSLSDIVIEYKLLLDEDRTNQGRPLCQYRQINSIPGFIKCDGSTLSLPGTTIEKDTIRQYLEGGFYYE